MRLICLVGPDGTGKTTQARLLADSLVHRGTSCKYVWFRFNHFFSLPLLAVARLTGLSTRREHRFWAVPPFAALYAVTQFVDNLLAAILRILCLIGQTMVCDRFVHDTIVDLSISTGFSLRTLEKLFRPIIPPSAQVFVFNADATILRKRRYDVSTDRLLDKKVEMYDRLAKDFELMRIDASNPISETSKSILKSVKI